MNRTVLLVVAVVAALVVFVLATRHGGQDQVDIEALARQRAQ